MCIALPHQPQSNYTPGLPLGLELVNHFPTQSEEPYEPSAPYLRPDRHCPTGNNVRRDLTEMGHRLQINVGSFGGYQAIMFDEKQGVYYGASESRKDGQAAGY